MRPAPGAVRMGWPRRARLFEVVAKTANGRFLWHENTTLLPPVSGAVDAGAKAPNMARRVCPSSRAAIGRRWQGATRAGRAASMLTQGCGLAGRENQYPERLEIGELISGRAALHDRRKIAGVEWMVRIVINTSDFKFCGEDNIQFANLLHA